MERPSLRLPPPVKFSFPVGGLLDIPTGEWIRGTHDQYILNGGISQVTGVVGPGNSFKTTIMRYMILSAINRTISTVEDTYYSTYDTENNTYEGRNKALSFQFDYLKQRAEKRAETLGGIPVENSILDEGVWQITSDAVYSGNKFFQAIKDYLKAKREQKNPYTYTTAYFDRDGKSPMKIMTPSFTDIDSLSQFTTDEVDKILNEHELGDSGANTVYMRQGKSKSQMLMEMPSLAAGSYHYFLFTAHIGKEIIIPQGPMTPQPKKQLQHMNAGEVIKGVSTNFLYLLHNCWLVVSAKPFLNQSTRAPEYPYEPGDERPDDKDLNIATLRQLRGKAGSSGYHIDLIVSQTEGVLPSLSEFHYLRRMKYGLDGNNVNYHLYIYPEVSLSRTKVRKLIREDAKLRRALEITSQLCQMEEFQRYLADKIVKPEELYKKIQEQGYDWNFILEKTRGWHTVDDEKHPLYPLSTYDLCRMARGEYVPYYLESDKKTVKKQYLKE